MHIAQVIVSYVITYKEDHAEKNLDKSEIALDVKKKKASKSLLKICFGHGLDL